ncbi:MAG: NrsF family protein [Sphingomonadaceae bacterium]
MHSASVENLVDDLVPVRPLQPLRAAGRIAGLTVLAALLVLALIGPRPDLGLAAVHPMFLVRTGILALLGIGATGTVLAMARPAVGSRYTGWRWALAAALVFPAAAIVYTLQMGLPSLADLTPETGLLCLGATLVLALGIGAFLADWLRRGAPTSPPRAGWMTGLAAGSLGALAYSVHCPHNEIMYIGFWYTIAVGLCALLGRILVPPLVRW